MSKTKKLSELINLKDKRVLVTGAGSGIGQAMVKRFSEAGAILYLLDINMEGLKETKSLTKTPDNISLFQIDLSKKKEIDNLWGKFKKGEEPETLINNAGIYPFMSFEKVDIDFYNKVMDINLNSVYWMCQHFIKSRRTIGGTIINISSIEAIMPFKNDLSAYSVSKAGVAALTRSLAREYGQLGFRVNCILPGAIKTPGTETLTKKAIRTLNIPLATVGYIFKKRLSLARWGDPDEVAKITLVLASDLSSYVQGALIPVDGGFLSS